MCPEGKRIPLILSLGSQDICNLVFCKGNCIPSEGSSSFMYRSVNNVKKKEQEVICSNL